MSVSAASSQYHLTYDLHSPTYRLRLQSFSAQHYQKEAPERKPSCSHDPQDPIIQESTTSVTMDPPGMPISQEQTSRKTKQLPPLVIGLPSRPNWRLQRPQPAETRTSEEQPVETPVTGDTPGTSRRPSRGRLLGILKRAKSTKDIVADEIPGVLPNEDDASEVFSARDDAASRISQEMPVSPMAGSSTEPRSTTPNSSLRHHMSRIGIRTMTFKKEGPAKDEPEAPSGQVKLSTESQSSHSGPETDAFTPPPLIDAYPQAVIHTSLATLKSSAAGSVNYKHRKASTVTRQHHAQTLAEPESADLGAAETTRELLEKKFKRRVSKTISKQSWEHKIYVLVKAGYILQYAGDGSDDRLPERVLMLRMDSAAVASDAIPGKHWVLRIAQMADDYGNATKDGPKTTLSRLGLSKSGRPTASFLLVLDSPQEMDSWLVAVRKQIEALGGKPLRSDPGDRKRSDAIVQQPRKPSLWSLSRKEQNQHIGSVDLKDNPVPELPEPKLVFGANGNYEGWNQRSFDDKPLPPVKRLSLNDALIPSPRASEFTVSFANQSPDPSKESLKHSDGSFTSNTLPRSEGSSSASVGTKTLDTSPSSSPIPSPVEEPLHHLARTREDSEILSPKSNSTRSIPQRAMQTISASPVRQRASPELRGARSSSSYSQLEYSRGSSSATPSTSQGSTVSFTGQRGRSTVKRPPLGVRESSATSIHGFPFFLTNDDELIIRDVRTSSAGASSTSAYATSVAELPFRSSRRLDVPAPLFSSADRPAPHRYSSMEHSRPVPHPISRSQSPHPPPTSALPALPVIISNTRYDGQRNPQPMLSRPTSAHSVPHGMPGRRARRPLAISAKSGSIPKVEEVKTPGLYASASTSTTDLMKGEEGNSSRRLGTTRDACASTSTTDLTKWEESNSSVGLGITHDMENSSEKAQLQSPIEHEQTPGSPFDLSISSLNSHTAKLSTRSKRAASPTPSASTIELPRSLPVPNVPSASVVQLPLPLPVPQQGPTDLNTAHFAHVHERHSEPSVEYRGTRERSVPEDCVNCQHCHHLTVSPTLRQRLSDRRKELRA